MDDGLYVAWTIIANAGGGDWTRESKDWQTAAHAWGVKYGFREANPPAPPPPEEPGRPHAYVNDCDELCSPGHPCRCGKPASDPCHLTGEEIARKLHAEMLARMPPVPAGFNYAVCEKCDAFPCRCPQPEHPAEQEAAPRTPCMACRCCGWFAEKCRNTKGPCFCGCHITPVAAPDRGEGERAEGCSLCVPWDGLVYEKCPMCGRAKPTPQPDSRDALLEEAEKALESITPGYRTNAASALLSRLRARKG